MPRTFPERESLIPGGRTPSLPTISSIASVLDPTSTSPPLSKKRKILNSPPRRPIPVATRLSSNKRPAPDVLERENTQTTVGYPGYAAVNPPASIDQRRHSNISSISHPETPALPPVSAITASRRSSSEAERITAPLPSLFSHTQPPTPHTSGSRYPYDPDYTPSYNPPYYRHSGEQHQSHHPSSPPSHTHYGTHSPPHHPPLLTQPFPSTRTAMYMPRPGQSASTQDRTPFSTSLHGGMEGYDQGARLGVKRRRGNLPKHVTDTLRTWLTNHVAHPYPTEEEKQQLCQVTGLNMNQVCTNGNQFS